MKTTTICVTGGTGFVGTGVVLALLQAGFQVRALVRNENSAKKLDIIPEEFRSSLSCIFGDPCHSDDIARALEGCSALVHLVGIRRHEIKKTGKTYRDIDVGSAIAATDAMKRTGVKRIVLLSAGAIGKSEYVRCKAEAEKAIVTAGLDWTIFRPAFIIAPGQQWPILMTPFLSFFALLGGHIADVARRAGNISRMKLASAFVNALQDPKTIGKTYDVPELRALGNKQI